MNNVIKIAEACGLAHAGFDTEDIPQYLGTKDKWDKAEKYWAILEEGWDENYKKIEEDLNIELE